MSRTAIYLPEPKRDRWQPMRGGLLNLFRFDREEFWFEQGRLLLRGDNGSGKSRVLAMQLPFLLDGETSPQRVEPDGAPAKRMEWNLLVGKYQDRLGYTWMEFGRLDATGAPIFLTIGIGMQAHEGKTGVNRWFFITPQRMGRDLYLETEAGNPLSKQALVEAVGSTGGEVFEKASSYRLAVNKALFGLDQARYEALINLLIQLRKPQLSKDLNEQALSGALSQALAPIPEGVVRELAEAFRGLEADRFQLGNLRSADAGVTKFLSVYKRYAQIAVRRSAGRVRKCHSEYEATQRALRDAERRAGEASAKLRGLSADEQIAKIGREEAEGEERALFNAPAMKKAGDLKSLQDSVARQCSTHASYRSQLEQSIAARTLSETAAELASDELNSAVNETGKAIDRANRAANILDVAVAWPANGGANAAAVSAEEKKLSDRIHSLRQGAVRLEALEAESRKALRAVEHAKRDVEGANGRYADAIAAQDNAQKGHDQAIGLFLDRFDLWRRQAQEIQLPTREAIEEDVWRWGANEEGTFPARRFLETARQEAADRLALHRHGLQSESNRVSAEAVLLAEELDRLMTGSELTPPIPHTRKNDRQDPGAPFWKVMDFHPEVGAEHRAGIEAALEASGILDAWVAPDGHLWMEKGEDIWLLEGPQAGSDRSRTLSAVLVPAIDTADPRAAGISTEMLHAVLGSIGFGESASAAWVAADGRWHLGPLGGRWTKNQATYIGHASRETNRRNRMEWLRSQLSELELRKGNLAAEIDACLQRQFRLKAEFDGFPSEEPIRVRFAELQIAGKSVAKERRALAELQDLLTDFELIHQGKMEQLRRAASDLSLTSWLGRLSSLVEAISALAFEAQSTWASLRRQGDRKNWQLETIRQLESANLEAEKWSGLALDSEKLLKGLEAELKALEENAGLEIKEILEKVAAVQKRKRDFDSDLAEHSQTRLDWSNKKTLAQRDFETFGLDFQARDAERKLSTDAFGLLAKTGAFTMAHPDLTVLDIDRWSFTKFVETARWVDDVLQNTEFEDAAWNRAEGEVVRQANDFLMSLGALGYHPGMEKQAEIYVVSVEFAGRMLDLGNFHAAIADDIARRQELLSAKEREVIESHLIGEIASHLHHALNTAEAWVRDVNRQLEARPTTTGMKLRFSWCLADDATGESVSARKLLMRTSSLWAPDERERLGQFLHKQIQRARENNEIGGWYEHLSEAFDYRDWHRFVVERHQDGKWKALTSRTHGTGSAGEKAVALTLPQFAAAASFFATASPHAPRLIMLDEAFAGIDRNMRANCLSFVRDFDLDFIMTSEVEWLCYQTLPGVAIYHLHIRKDIDAVWASRWVWNGKERKQEKVPA